jgi:hypothetical protein
LANRVLLCYLSECNSFLIRTGLFLQPRSIVHCRLFPLIILPLPVHKSTFARSSVHSFFVLHPLFPSNNCFVFRHAFSLFRTLFPSCRNKSCSCHAYATCPGVTNLQNGNYPATHRCLLVADHSLLSPLELILTRTHVCNSFASHTCEKTGVPLLSSRARTPASLPRYVLISLLQSALPSFLHLTAKKLYTYPLP